MDNNVGYAMILMGILGGAFFIRWGRLSYLFSIMPWRCKNNDWIRPWLFFIGAEACFALAAGAGIVSALNGVDTLFGESFFFAGGLLLRGWLRMGLMDDGLDEPLAEEIFNPWRLAKI